MTYYILPQITTLLMPKNIKVKFDEKKSETKILNPSLCKYLNYNKNLISNCLYNWDNVKKYTNPYEFIHTPIPKQNMAVSKINLYLELKLLEIYNTFKIFEKLPNKINTFHLAEGPGGFIEATTYMRKIIC